MFQSSFNDRPLGRPRSSRRLDGAPLQRRLLALAVALAIVPAAQASQINLGVLDGTTRSFSELSSNIGPLSSQLEFTLDTAALVTLSFDEQRPAATLGSGSVAIGGGSFVNGQMVRHLDNFSIRFKGSKQALLSDKRDPDSFGIGSSDYTRAFAGVVPLQLHAGHYAFEINARADGFRGGAYGGTVSLSPVPEPTSMALLLSGLGVLARLSRRQRPNPLR